MSASSDKSRPCVGISGGAIAWLLIFVGIMGTSACGSKVPPLPSSTNPQATSSAIAQMTAAAQASATVKALTQTPGGDVVVLSVIINSPTNESKVGSPITVSGQASNIPAGKELWLFVEGADVGGYFPQLTGDPTDPQPITIFSDGWSIETHIGLEGGSTVSIGKKFLLIPALIDRGDNEAHQAIKRYFQDGYIPIEPLPSQIELLTRYEVQVVRI